MRLKLETTDISTRLILLNSQDARAMSVFDGDRVNVTNIKTKQTSSIPVTITNTLIKSGTAKTSAQAGEEIGLISGGDAEIRAAVKPESIKYIRKKMDGGRLSREETSAIISDMTKNILSPSEITSYITAAYINGMNLDETEYLTREMVASGDRITFSQKPIVDKHSIGGVPGNKITLLVVPIIAAAGFMIPKTCSRAITGAGGTADLMEALAPVSFTASEIKTMVEKAGAVIAWGGSTNIAPADDIIIKYEYPLKIDARGQMLASIMAKKMAVGSDICVIDIPVGPGTKVADEKEGRALANDLIELGRRIGIKVECAITYGGAPVGRNIGVNLEVYEALNILEGNKGADSFIQKSCAVAGIALEMTGKADRNYGAAMAYDILKSGKALKKMQDIIEIQGGDPKIKSTDLTFGSFTFDVPAPCDGFVISIKNRSLIDIARLAGSPADHGAGIHINKKPGQSVKKGETLFTIYSEKEWRLTQAIETARITNPVIVEGMLISRVPSIIRAA